MERGRNEGRKEGREGGRKMVRVRNRERVEWRGKKGMKGVRGGKERGKNGE